MRLTLRLQGFQRIVRTYGWRRTKVRHKGLDILLDLVNLSTNTARHVDHLIKRIGKEVGRTRPRFEECRQFILYSSFRIPKVVCEEADDGIWIARADKTRSKCSSECSIAGCVYAKGESAHASKTALQAHTKFSGTEDHDTRLGCQLSLTLGQPGLVILDSHGCVHVAAFESVILLQDFGR